VVCHLDYLFTRRNDGNDWCVNSLDTDLRLFAVVFNLLKEQESIGAMFRFQTGRRTDRDGSKYL